MIKAKMKMLISICSICILLVLNMVGCSSETDYSHIYKSNEYIGMCQDYGDLSYIVAGGDIVLPNDLNKSLGLNVWSLAQTPIHSITYGTNTVFQSTIPKTVENIYVSENNTEYISKDGVLYSADGKTLITFPGGRKGEYQIPEGVEEIGAAAFWGCNLTSVYVPDSVERICSQAFSESKLLTNISLPTGIRYDASETPFPLEWINDLNSYRVQNSLTIEYRGTMEQWNLDTQYLEYVRTMNVVTTE